MGLDINSVVLVGRLTNDVDLRYTPSGSPVAKFGLAVSGMPKDGQENVSFFNIVVWGKSADFCSQYIKKGDRICLNGRIEQRTYTAQDGARRSIIEIVAERVQSLTPPKGDYSQKNSTSPQKQAQPNHEEEQTEYDYNNEKDVPF